VVRNPLERIKSAFNYDKPDDWDNFRLNMGEKYYNYRKQLYMDCPFETLEDLAQLGLKQGGNATDECKERAATSLLGTGHYSCHFYYNYQFHLEGIPETARLMTIRTEHIIEDWNSVEVELGGKKEIMGSPTKKELSRKNANTKTTDSDKFLSEESQVLICKLLCNDIQVYKEILRRSINLDERNYAQSMEDLRESCPLEADTIKCDTELPNIHQKLVASRGYGQPEVVSPYEQHWQGKYYLPSKMKKDYTIYLSKVDKNEVCFVDAGMNDLIGCALGFKLSCPNESVVPGLLPQHTTRRFHCGVYDCFDDSSYYLFVLRNPLDRLISSFNYDRPTDWEEYKKKEGERQYNFRKMLYKDCPFDTIDDLAQLGLTRNGNVTDECRQRALGAVEGTVQTSKQLYYNLQYYLEGIPVDASIITLRVEHALEDWNSAETTIGGKGNILSDQTLIAIEGVNTTVSEASRAILCEKLCNEIQVYKAILGVSVNLSKKQVKESIEELTESCPLEARATSCNAPITDITEKLYLGRGYDASQVLVAVESNAVKVGRATQAAPPSPYELIWPTYTLPQYMKKDRQYVVDVPQDKKICFTHIGKTAGSTVGCALGFNLHCSGNAHAPGLFPKYTTNMLHCQMYDCWDDSAYSLFVVRNPLERLISAFNYDNPSKDWSKFRREYGEKHYNLRKHLYKDCPFNTLNQLAQLGLSKHGNATEECRGRAARAVEGTEHFGDHVSIFSLT
jgi:hypothetical protein